METPCISVCELDEAAGICIGCGRNLAEIGGWRALTDSERVAVMATLGARLERLPADALAIRAIRVAAIERNGRRPGPVPDAVETREIN